MGPETNLVNKIRTAIKVVWPDAWLFKVVGNPYQEAGVPDILGCINGIFVGLEVKCPQPGESPATARSRTTKLQRQQLARIDAAGGIADVVLSVDEALAVIRNRVPSYEERDA